MILDSATHRNGQPQLQEMANPDLADALELLSDAALKLASMLGGSGCCTQSKLSRPARTARPAVRKFYEHELDDNNLCRVLVWANLPGNAWAGKFKGKGRSLALARRLLSAYRFCGVSAGAGNWPDDRLYRVGDIRAMAARKIDDEPAKHTTQWFALERAVGLRAASSDGLFHVFRNNRIEQLSFKANA